MIFVIPKYGLYVSIKYQSFVSYVTYYIPPIFTFHYISLRLVL